MKLLICTDGSPAAEQAALLVSRLGLSRDVELTLLGVIDEHGNPATLDASFDRMTSMLGGAQPNLKRLIRRGDSYEQILAEAVQHAYDLVVVGGGGQHHGLLHFKVGSTTSKLARKLHTHFLVARNVPEPDQKGSGLHRGRGAGSGYDAGGRADACWFNGRSICAACHVANFA